MTWKNKATLASEQVKPWREGAQADGGSAIPSPKKPAPEIKQDAAVGSLLGLGNRQPAPETRRSSFIETGPVDPAQRDTSRAGTAPARQAGRAAREQDRLIEAGAVVTPKRAGELRQQITALDGEIAAIEAKINSGEIRGQGIGYATEAIARLKGNQADIQAKIESGVDAPVTLGDVGSELINAPIRGGLNTLLGGASGVADYAGFDEVADRARDGREIITEAFAAPVSASQNELMRLAGQGGEAIGSTIPFLPAGLGRQAAAGVGVMAFGTGVDQQDARVKAVRAEGGEVSGTQEVVAETFGGIVGLTEMLPVKALLSKVPKGYGGLVMDKLGERLSQRAIGRVGGAMVEEGVQEAAAGVAQDLVELGVYNENVQVGQSALEDFALGAFAGGAIRGGVELVDGSGRLVRRRADDTRAPAPGNIERAVKAASTPTQADIDSPLDTGDIAEGKAIIAQAQAEKGTERELGLIGMPNVGTRVTITDPELGAQSGTMRDRFTGPDGSGVVIELDDGKIMREFDDTLADLGISITAEPQTMTGEADALDAQMAAAAQNAISSAASPPVAEEAPPSAAPDPSPEDAAGGGAPIKASGKQGEVAGVLSQAGFNPNVVAGFLGNFEVEGGYGGARGDGGSASGIAQWRNERRDNFRKQFGKDPDKATAAEQAQFVVWEMNNPGKAGMTPAQRDAILAAKSPEEAARLIDQFYERSDGKARERRAQEARKFAGNMPVGEAAPAAEEAASEEDTGGRQRTSMLDREGVNIPEGQRREAVQDDMFGGPSRTESDIAAREGLDQVLAQAQEESPDLDLADTARGLRIALRNMRADVASGNATPNPRIEDYESADFETPPQAIIDAANANPAFVEALAERAGLAPEPATNEAQAAQVGGDLPAPQATPPAGEAAPSGNLGNVTFADSSSGKGLIVSGLSDAQAEILRSTVPQAKAAPMSGGRVTYSKKHEAAIRAALAADAPSAQGGAPARGKANFDTPEFKRAMQKLGSLPNRESPVGAEMLQGWNDGQGADLFELDRKAQQLTQGQDGPVKTYREDGFNPRQGYIEAFYAAVMGEPVQVRAVGNGQNFINAAEAVRRIKGKLGGERFSDPVRKAPEGDTQQQAVLGAVDEGRGGALLSGNRNWLLSNGFAREVGRKSVPDLELTDAGRAELAKLRGESATPRQPSNQDMLKAAQDSGRLEIVDARPKAAQGKGTAAERARTAKLRDWKGIEVPDYSEQGQRGEYDGGPTKDAFLKDGRDYLKSVETLLREQGFEPRLDRKGKPDKAVRVNEGGTAVAGDVYLEMYRPNGGRGVQVQYGMSALNGPAGGASLIARPMTQRDGRYVQGDNNWWPVDLTAEQLVERLVKLAPESQSAPATPAPAQGGGRTPNQQKAFVAGQAAYAAGKTRMPPNTETLIGSWLDGWDAAQAGSPAATSNPRREGELSWARGDMRGQGGQKVAPGDRIEFYKGYDSANLAGPVEEAGDRVYRDALLGGAGITDAVQAAADADKQAAPKRTEADRSRASWQDMFDAAGKRMRERLDAVNPENLKDMLGAMADRDMRMPDGDLIEMLNPHRAVELGYIELDVDARGNRTGKITEAGRAFAAATPAANAATPEARPAATPSANTIVTDDRAAELRRRLAEKINPGRLNSGIDPEIFSLGAELAVYHIERGARRFIAMSKAIAADLSMKPADLRRYLRSWYDGARNMMEDSDVSVDGMDSADTVRALLGSIDDWGDQVTAAPEPATGGNDDGPSILGTGAEPLEGVAPPRIPSDAESGNAEPGGAAGQQGSGAAGGKPDGKRPSTPRSGGNRPARPDPASTGGRDGPARTDDEVISPAEAIETGSATNVPFADFVITDEVELGQGTAGQKYDDNIAAIRLLKQLEGENRRAGPSEQRTLARYVGWGGLKNAFRVAGAKDGAGVAKGWEKRVAELEELLTPEELRAARNSTTAAHYTSQTVVEAMWQAVERLGFGGGAVLEPSVGTGNFLGLMPAGMRKNARVFAVEYDGLTARIAQQLYPNAAVVHSGFQDVPLPRDQFALAIGNPPFGRESLFFRYNPSVNGSSIHNQFFMASLDAVAEGGLMAMVVSHNLMDALNNSNRLALAADAQFLGGIRLPDIAFKENAGTEVVTDMLFFRKRDRDGQKSARDAIEHIRTGKKPKDTNYGHETVMREIEAWTSSEAILDPAGSGEFINVNNYFRTNPNMVIGKIDASGTMNARVSLNVTLADPAQFQPLLQAAVERLPKNTPNFPVGVSTLMYFEKMAEAMRLTVGKAEVGAVRRDQDGKLKTVLAYPDGPLGKNALREIELTENTPFNQEYDLSVEGKWQRTVDLLDEKGKPVKVRVGDRITNRNAKEIVTYQSETDIPARDRWGKERIAIVQDLLPIRDAMKRQLALESQDATDEMISLNRQMLNKAYDSFVKKHGNLNSPKVAKIAMLMPDGALALAAEQSSGDKKNPSYTKAAILSKRVTMPPKQVESAKNASDAIAISLGETGTIEIERIASLLGTDEAGAEAALSEGDEPRAFFDPELQRWEPRDIYLSGLVRRKMHAARAAGLEQNVQALEEVMPADWDASQITPSIGSGWVPGEIYADFLRHLGYAAGAVSYSQATNSFSVSFQGDAAAQWRTSGRAYSAGMIVTRLLNSQNMRVTWTDQDGKTHLDEEATAESQQKASEIFNEFLDWAYLDDSRRTKLVETFNERFNTRLVRQRDGSHLKLPGKVPDTVIKMRRHQMNAIWRGITDRAVLYDHVVGAGKTFTAIARVMERRRMGLSRKPMVVVPNHLVEQWAHDARVLYPGINLLAATKGDFERKNRRRLFARIGSGDYDMVIIGHSSFGFIDLDQATEERFIMEELRIAQEAVAEAQEAADEAGYSGFRKPFGVAEAERLVKKLEERLSRLRDGKRDRLLTFEEMGIDDLSIDEAHEFKNLSYSSRLQGVAGMGNKNGSRKAMDLHLKIRSLRERQGTSVAFLTGTPISNSVAEMYLVLRNLAWSELRDLGLENFDAWRTMHVSATSAYEPTEAGGIKEVTRLGREWQNMRALMDLYYSVSDAVTLEDIKVAFAEDNPGKEFPVPKVASAKRGDGDRERVYVEPTPETRVMLSEIVADFESLPYITDAKERNIQRLKLMDRARKISLDPRAVDPRAEVTSEGGKIAVVAERAAGIYRKWDADKGTQIIFLDRSVPTSKGDDKIVREYDALREQLEKALRDGDEKAEQTVMDALEKFNPSEIEALRDALAGGWNAYDEIKRQLVARGIPANEIRFVQEASTDQQKLDLFRLVKEGKVRIIIGSTPRMGAGTNVQDRLVALHHVDVTWKPSDIEQREGRIVRQGNKLLEKYGDKFEVDVIAYATKMSVDAKMWSLNADKLKAINGIRKYDGSFQMEFEDAESASMAEMAALATGNPLMVERVTLDSEIQKLTLQQRSFNNRTNAMREKVASNKRLIENGPAAVTQVSAFADKLEADLARIAEESAARSVTVEGKSYSDRQEANQAALAAIAAQRGDDEKARFSIEIDGQKVTSIDVVNEAIRAKMGTAGFTASVGGQTFIDTRDAANAIAKMAAGRGERAFTINGLTVMDSPAEIDIGTGGIGKKRDAVLAIMGPNGRTVTQFSNWTEGLTPARFASLLGKAQDGLNPAMFRADARHKERAIASAKEELPSLETEVAKPWPKLDELAEKRVRLREVIAELEASKAPQIEDGDVVREDGEAFNATPTIVYHGGTLGPMVSPNVPFFVSADAEFAESYATERGRGRGRLQAFTFTPKKTATEDQVIEAARRVFGDEVDQLPTYAMLDPNVERDAVMVIAALEAQGFDSATFMDLQMNTDFDMLPVFAVFDAGILSNRRFVNDRLYSPSDQAYTGPDDAGNPQGRNAGDPLRGDRDSVPIRERDAGRTGAQGQPDRGRVRVRELGIAAEIQRTGSAALVGREVTAPSELAELAQVYRDPRYETFRVFFMRGNEIVHATGVTSRLPDQAPLIADGGFDDFAQWLMDTKASSGADGYYLLHNHPSGNPTPSPEDTAITRRIAQRVSGFRSHVVINSNRFAFITADGGTKTREQNFGPDALIAPSKPGPLLGRLVNDHERLAAVAKLAQREGYVTIIGTSKLAVRTVVEVPAHQIERSEKYLLGLLRRIMRKSGSTDLFLVGEGDVVLSDKAGKAFREKLLTEAIATDGRTLSQMEAYRNPRAQRQRDSLFSRTANAQFVAEERDMFDASPMPERDAPIILAGQDPTWRGKMESAYNEFRRAAQDRYLPLLRVQRDIELRQGTPLPPEMNPYLGEELMAGRIGARLETLMEDRVRPLFDAMADEKVTTEELETYLYARHAPERNARIAEINPEFTEGTGSGMTDLEARAIMARIERDGKLDAMKRLAEKVDRIRDETLDKRVEYGLMSESEADEWRATYENYVPLRGFAEGGGDPADAARINRSGGGINVRGRESKAAFGRRSVADSPVAYLILQAEEAIVRGETNITAQRFVDLARANPDDAFWKVNKVQSKTRINPDTGLVERYLVTSLTAEDKDWTVVAKFNGKERRVTMNRANPEALALADAMRNLTQHQLDFVTKYLGSVNRFLSRVNTSYNPEFVISNAIRDVQTAAFNLTATEQEGMVTDTLKNYRAALVASTKGAFGNKSGDWGKWYQEFIEDGGRVYFNQVEDVELIKKRMRRVAEQVNAARGEKNVRLQAKRMFRATVDTIENVNLGVENAIRLAAYRAARERGMSRERAASLAKNLTVNFNRRGTFGPVANALYLFFNASVQGSVRMLQATRSKRLQKVLAGVALSAAAIEIMNAMVSGDDDDGESFYDKIPDYEKRSNIIIMLPNGKDYVKLPLPYGYNVFYGAGRTMAEIARRGGDRWKESASSLLVTALTSFNPIGFEFEGRSGWEAMVSFVTPSAFDPIVDLSQNRDFTGRPIMPEENPYGPPEPTHQRYFAGVAPYWVGISDFLNRASGGDDVQEGAVSVSPGAMEHLFGTVVGAAGAFLDRTAAIPSKLADPEFDFDVSDVPFARKAVGAPPRWYNKSAYYERIGTIEGVIRDTKDYLDREQFDSAREYAEANAVVLSLEPVMKDAQKEMRAIRKAKREIEGQYELGKIDKATFNRERALIGDAEDIVINSFNTAWNQSVRNGREFGAGE
jgi:N12 class adenine-specific DNA methylase